MNRITRYLGLSAVLAPVLGLASGGCGTDASDVGENQPVNVDVPSGTGAGSGASEAPSSGNGSVDDDSVENYGLWRGHWDGKQLTFTPLDERAANGGVRPQGFVQVDDEKFVLSTLTAMVVNNAPGCAANAGTNYYVDGAPHPFNGTTCTNGHLCAMVEVKNNTNAAGGTPKRVDSVYVEISDMDPSTFAGSNSSPVPTGYPLTAAHGLWSYSGLNAGQATNVRWDIALPSCDTFSFTARILGTLRKTDYGFSDGLIPVNESFTDACNIGGHQTVLVGAGPNASTNNMAFPFPFTLYSTTFDTNLFPNFKISTNGSLGYFPSGAVPTSGVGLPTSGRNFAISAFWENLKTPDGVCYATVGTPGSRQFVATWKNAQLSPTTDTVTFSAILNEGTDQIVFEYESCSDLSRLNGDKAVVGVQGNNSTARVFSNRTAFPFEFCPNGYRVTATGTPPSSL